MSIEDYDRNIKRLVSGTKFIAVLILLLVLGSILALSIRGTKFSQGGKCPTATYHQIDNRTIITACGDTLRRDERSFILGQ